MSKSILIIKNFTTYDEICKKISRYLMFEKNKFNNKKNTTK